MPVHVGPRHLTLWLDRLQAGDPAAVQHLWEGYFQRLVALARDRLRYAPRTMADEEDVALSAFESFCRGAGQGRFPRLADRDDLWRLLLVITDRKAIDLAHHERAGKRGGGKVRHAGGPADDSSAAAPLDNLPSAEPTPDLAAQLAEEVRRLLDVLADEILRGLAVAKMEGYTNEEIAAQRGCSVPTVERKLSRIRLIWEKEVAP